MDRSGKPPAAVYLLFALLLAVAGTSTAGARQDFLAAESALKRGDRVELERLADGLRHYPLYPYLRFQALKRRLSRAADEEVESFLVDHADTPLSARIRRAWLGQLAAGGRWDLYARFYVRDDSVERRCLFLYSLTRTGRAREAFDQVADLWLTGESRPSACDRLFDAWRSSGRLAPELVWARIALAMDRGNIDLARYLRRHLPRSDRPRLDSWLEVSRQPELVLQEDRFGRPHAQRGPILVHGVERLAKRDPQKAARTWDLLERRYDFPPLLTERAESSVGLALANDGEARGLDYLGRIRSRRDNIRLQEQRLRAALRLQDWPRVGAWVGFMPEGERKSEHWLYWRARALAVQGRRDAATKLFAEAAKERSLWGFLSAERVGAPYHLDQQPVPVSDGCLKQIEQGPAARRVAELRAIGRDLDVRREIHWLAQDQGPEALMATAVLARRWGFPDLAITVLAKSGYWDDLDLRFPTLYREPIGASSRDTGLDASWIFAVLRQESAFNPHAASPAGALGLMQLMPATARDLARSLGERRPSRWQLLEPERSIRLGSRYLARMQKRFGNPVLATAAYNAGPGRVEQWLPAEATEADVWVATIPFRETRRYVRRVLAYRLIYDHILGQDIKRLSEVMKPVGGDGTSPEPRGSDAGAARG